MSEKLDSVITALTALNPEEQWKAFDAVMGLSQEAVQDLVESRQVMYSYGPLTTRCVGGRIVAKNYRCARCGSVDPATQCHDPRTSTKLV